MGGKHIKSSNDFATIHIQLAKLSFCTGEVVQGEVQLHVRKPLPALFMDISIKGK